jgi:hypothetical protein
LSISDEKKYSIAYVIIEKKWILIKNFLSKILKLLYMHY